MKKWFFFSNFNSIKFPDSRGRNFIGFNPKNPAIMAKLGQEDGENLGGKPIIYGMILG